MTNNYYQKQKYRLQKEARERYQNLPEEEKEKKGEKRPKTDMEILLKKKKSAIRIFQRGKSKS